MGQPDLLLVPTLAADTPHHVARPADLADRHRRQAQCCPPWPRWRAVQCPCVHPPGEGGAEARDVRHRVQQVAVGPFCGQPQAAAAHLEPGSKAQGFSHTQHAGNARNVYASNPEISAGDRIEPATLEPLDRFPALGRAAVPMHRHGSITGAAPVRRIGLG